MRFLDELLRRSEATHELTLDEIGEVIGPAAVTGDEIDGLFSALEAAGRNIVSPEGAGGPETLRTVLTAARDHQKETGRRPSLDELAARTGLSLVAIRHALAFGRVMGR